MAEVHGKIVKIQQNEHCCMADIDEVSQSVQGLFTIKDFVANIRGLCGP